MSAAHGKLKCPRCGYEWEPRVANPKKCPRCGYWLQRWEVKRDEHERQ
ncbi:MAG: hypothetical protein RXP77_04890 [Nitrososphaeria archaeon]